MTAKETGEKMEEENEEEIIENNEIEEVKEEKKREITIPGEKIVSGKEYLPGDGTRRENDDIVAGRFGLADISGRLVRVIPLSGIFMPRLGNVIIGRVVDITFNGWIIDMNAPYLAFLSLMEFSRYVRGDLTEHMDIGDMVVAKVYAIKHKGIDLTVKSRGLGKLEGGMIIYINSNKVPRVIGREGSMIKLIKDNTNCEIVVGQNGVVWISGDNVENELKAKEAIMFVVNKSYVGGLTEKVKEYFEGGEK